MLRKILISSFVCGCILFGYANPVNQNSPQPAPESEQTLPDGQQVMEVTEPNSEEVSTVQESPEAKKMTQAEKAANAKENDGYGFAITIIAMTIVISALVILSILFLCFGKLSEKVMTFKKKKVKIERSSHDAHEEHDVDSGETIAAIAMALAEHFSTPHDVEDTILTIKRMKKSYSPWNSKIYNMTQLPVIHHNTQVSSATNRK